MLACLGLLLGCGGLSSTDLIQSPSESKSAYLERLGLQMSGVMSEFSSLCAKGNGRACYVIASRFDAGSHGVPQSSYAAERIFTLGCELGESTSCLALAERFQTQGLHRQARALLLQECDRGQLLACGRLGVMEGTTSSGLGRSRIACRGGVAQSCFVLGAHARSQDDFDAATLHFRKACDGGQLSGCDALAALQIRECTKAIEPERQRLCRESVVFAKKEWSRWTDGCKRGLPLPCALSTRKDFKSGDGGAAVTRLAASCEAGEPIACHLMGGILRTGRYLDRDLVSSLRMYSLACHNGAVHSCFYAAMGQWAMDEATQRERAVEVIRKSCRESRHEPSCRWLASNCVRDGDCPPVKPILGGSPTD